MAFALSSTAFSEGAAVPTRYTCEGEDVSPPLEWRDPPAGTRSFALIVDDPDAPDPAAPRVRWVHWVLYNIPPDVHRLLEGEAHPAGSSDGLNDWKRTGYGGPCPPIGRHRYFHTLYALDAMLPDLRNPTRAILDRAMKPHVLGTAVLMGTYEKRSS